MNVNKELNCYKCKKKLTIEDNYCNTCGLGQGKHIGWYYKHWGIMMLIFLLGPFTLYFVIFSPAISKLAKWIYTLIILAFTTLIGMQGYLLFKTLSKVYGFLSYSDVF